MFVKQESILNIGHYIYLLSPSALKDKLIVLTNLNLVHSLNRPFSQTIILLELVEKVNDLHIPGVQLDGTC